MKSLYSTRHWHFKILIRFDFWKIFSRFFLNLYFITFFSFFPQINEYLFSFSGQNIQHSQCTYATQVLVDAASTCIAQKGNLHFRYSYMLSCLCASCHWIAITQFNEVALAWKSIFSTIKLTLLQLCWCFFANYSIPNFHQRQTCSRQVAYTIEGRSFPW